MNIELLKKFHRDARIANSCPTKYLPLSAACDLTTAAEYMRKSWDSSTQDDTDVANAKAFVSLAFGKVLACYVDIDLEEVAKAVPTWKGLAMKVEDPSKLVGDAFMDAISQILDDTSGAYKATSVFGVLCAVLNLDPDELIS